MGIVKQLCQTIRAEYLALITKTNLERLILITPQDSFTNIYFYVSIRFDMIDRSC